MTAEIPTITIDTNRANTADAMYGALLERRHHLIARIDDLETRMEDMQATRDALQLALINVSETIGDGGAL